MAELRMALFDFDGTLCDSAASIIRLTQHACAVADVPAPEESAIRRNIGEGLLAAGVSYAGGDEAKAQIIFDAYRAQARVELADAAKPIDPLFDGAKEALIQMADDGWLIGIVTNKGRHGLQKMMARHEIDHLIDVSFTADDVAVKPAPDMAIAAINHFGVSAQNAVLVGDTINDALCAKGAKIAFIGTDWGYHGNDVLVANGAKSIAMNFPDLVQKANQLVPQE